MSRDGCTGFVRLGDTGTDFALRVERVRSIVARTIASGIASTNSRPSFGRRYVELCHGGVFGMDGSCHVVAGRAGKNSPRGMGGTLVPVPTGWIPIESLLFYVSNQKYGGYTHLERCTYSYSLGFVAEITELAASCMMARTILLVGLLESSSLLIVQ